MRRVEHGLEYGDRPMATGDLAPYLDDLERLNALALGYRLTIRALHRLLGHALRTRPAVVVDVGGGRGDLALRIARDARKHGRSVTVVVVDRDEASLVIGARAAKTDPEIRWVQADATALPLRARSVDVAVTSLTLHHLPPDAAVAALRGMREASRLGVIVNDLIRSRVALTLCWLATRVVARHRYARHDGPLSIRRSYAARELHALARRAGFRRFDIRRHRVLARLIGVGA